MENWDDLKYFLQVAKSGNVTAASQILGVNHSTVSRRVKALEETHGVRLFERIASGYKLTEAGSKIVEIAELMEANSLQISRQLFAHDSSLQGPINLTMPNDLLDYCLMESIGEFRRLFPKVTMNLSVSKGLKNLAAREADVAVRFTANPPEYLIGSEVCKLQQGLYCRDDFDISQPIKLIVWQDELQIPIWAKTHFPKAEIAMRVDDCHSMLAAVKKGIGIARIPCFLPDIIDDRSIRRLNFSLPHSNWGVWVLSHIDLRDTIRVKRCREFLREAILAKKAYFHGEVSNFY